MKIRKPVIAGNWKMHGSTTSVATLLASLPQARCDNIQTIVFAPYVFLPQVEQLLTATALTWGAQNVSQYSQGAYTGEISASMLLEFGCQYVLIGHSERRALYHETDELVALKCQAASRAGLISVFCVGETLVERKAGNTEQVIAKQLAALANLPDWTEISTKLIIAYEPVWAIGTGMTATPEQAQQVHEYIRAWLKMQAPTVAATLQILYGGSMKLANAADLLVMPDIDGGLIGGASLDAQEFLGIMQLCNSLF